MKALITIFNYINDNDRVRVANTKEDIEQLFQRFEKYDVLITTGLREELRGISPMEREKELATINMQDLCGKIENIEIVETDKKGYGDLPIYEVYGDIVAFDNPSGKLFEDCLNQDILKIVMRSIVQHTIDKDKDIRLIHTKKIICWDVI